MQLLDLRSNTWKISNIIQTRPKQYNSRKGANQHF